MLDKQSSNDLVIESISKKKTIKNTNNTFFKTRKAGPNRFLLSLATGNFIQLSDGRTHYHFFKGKRNKPIIVCLHGISSKGTSWLDFAKLCNKQGYSVLCPDFYGRGFSDAVPKERNNIHLFTTQIAELLTQIYSLYPILPQIGIYLIGMSMGGAVAAEFTRIYTKLVRKTILIAPAGLIKHPPIVNLAISLGLHKLLSKFITRSRIKQQLTKSFYNKSNPKIQDYISYLVEETLSRKKNHKGHILSINSTISNFEFTKLLDTYKVINKNNTPLFVIWGDKDVICSFTGLDIIKNTVSNVKTLVLKDCGHLDFWVIPKLKKKVYTSSLDFFNS